MDYKLFKQPIKSGHVSYGYTYRSTGRLTTNQSIKNFLKTIYSHPRVSIMNQLHTNKITIVQKLIQPINVFPKTDGLFYPAAQLNTFLVVKTADCLPILAWDQEGNLGVVHAGWRGSLKKILIQLLKKFKTTSPLDQIFLFFGPSIRACCYPIYGPRLKLFQNTFPQWQKSFIINYSDHQGLDLATLNFLQATESGVPPSNITIFPECTACHHDRFYSYRGESKIKGNIISWLGLN